MVLGRRDGWLNSILSFSFTANANKERHSDEINIIPVTWKRIRQKSPTLKSYVMDFDSEEEKENIEKAKLERKRDIRWEENEDLGKPS